jgi:hypothetical protein
VERNKASSKKRSIPHGEVSSNEELGQYLKGHDYA